jgi:uncharacterized protein
MNRLRFETSPYLLQHADNPVDWYPWGEEAFTRAREQDKPVLLSIGYSACHWCHVMAHESFEDAETAAMMNARFVNIKVDREERPDVDDIYMQAVQALTQHGGWPLTVFLTPEGRPFYGGTYYPPERRHGMPAFRELLEAVSDAYRSRRSDLDAQAEQLTVLLQRGITPQAPKVIPAETLNAAADHLLGHMDRHHGGFGGAPKFPNTTALEVLLRAHVRTGRGEYLEAVRHTLAKMAAGGIHDQLGGGFARYATDAGWVVPHFEKMLYDNAQLLRLYVHLYQLTGADWARLTAERLADFVLREMTDAAGGFASTLDADSEGVEGRYYVWTMAEIDHALADLREEQPIVLAFARAAYGVTEAGNFEGHSILVRALPLEELAAQFDLDLPAASSLLEAVRGRLLAAREARIRPGLDDKVLAAWNGMMVASLAVAARVFGRQDYLEAAIRAGDFLRQVMSRPDARLYRVYRQGQARLNGYLEDYAHVIDAMLELYQSTFAPSWFDAALSYANTVLTHFSAEGGGFYDTSDDHEALIVRPRSLQDTSMPSATFAMARQLLRLGAYTGEYAYEAAALGALAPVADVLGRYPLAFGEALNVADMLATGLKELAILGDASQPGTLAMLAGVQQRYSPNLVVALAKDADAAAASPVPLLHHREGQAGKSTAYVCRNFTCEMPVFTVEELLERLDRA